MSRITVLPYSSTYERKFEKIKGSILRAVGEEIEIHHVGSTAVPSMHGKGVIDIMIGVKDWREGEKTVRSLSRIGFFQGEANRGRVFLSLRKGMKDTHIHIVRAGTKQYNDFLKLRDYLRTHPKERTRYLKLKRSIYPLWPSEKERYVKLKDEYVKSFLRQINKSRTPSGQIIRS